MFVRLYSLEELSDYPCHGYYGGNASPFSDSETIFSDYIYMHWFGSDLVEFEILESLL